MVIDTSAIVAIALNEPDAPGIEVHIADDPVRLISAATVLEATISIRSLSPQSSPNGRRSRNHSTRWPDEANRFDFRRRHPAFPHPLRRGR